MSKLVAVLRLASKGLKLYNPKHNKTIKLLQETADKVDKNMADTADINPETVNPEPVNPEPEPESPKPSPSPGFNKTRDYTRRQAMKHLIAVEDHLKSDDEDVCRSCLGEKHLPALSQYAEEGFDYCGTECGAYEQLKNIVSKAEEAMKTDFDENTRRDLAEEFRGVRKELSPSKDVAEEVVEKLS